MPWARIFSKSWLTSGAVHSSMILPFDIVAKSCVSGVRFVAFVLLTSDATAVEMVDFLSRDRVIYPSFHA